MAEVGTKRSNCAVAVASPICANTEYRHDIQRERESVPFCSSEQNRRVSIDKDECVVKYKRILSGALAPRELPGG